MSASLRTRSSRAGDYAGKDDKFYHVLHVVEGQLPGVPPGKYLVDDQGLIRYLVDPAINGRLTQRDDGSAVNRFEAPKTRLMALIIDGILNQQPAVGTRDPGGADGHDARAGRHRRRCRLRWGCTCRWARRCRSSCGGLVRWLVDKIRGGSAKPNRR